MKKIVLIIYLLIGSFVYADFEVAPQIQYINLDRPGTIQLHLKNPTKKLKKIKIYAETPKDQKDPKIDMTSWVIIYPKIVYLKPNSKQLVRLAVRAPKGLAAGEYRSYLVFEELPTTKYNAEKDTNTKSASLNILYKIISTMYGYKGKLIYDGEYENFRILIDETSNKEYLLSNIKNTGTTALDVYYNLTYYNGEKELEKEDVRAVKVMRENSKKSIIELKKLPKTATKIKIEALYREGGEEADKKTFKLGEKIIPIKTITKEEYLKELEEAKIKEEKKEKEDKK